jgi:broad specificity phosphatase PhoE
MVNGGLKKNFPALKRQPFFSPIWLAGLATLATVAAIAIIGCAAWAYSRAESTTVIVVRHAEKDQSVAADPPLTAVGAARAEQLAVLFGSATPPGRLTAILSSPALRCRLTVAPVAAKLGITPIIVPEAADSTAAAALVRRILRDYDGGRVLIAAHGDTIPAIVAALSGRADIPPIAVDEYGTLYIVTVPRLGAANLLRLHY